MLEQSSIDLIDLSTPASVVAAIGVAVKVFLPVLKEIASAYRQSVQNDAASVETMRRMESTQETMAKVLEHVVSRQDAQAEKLDQLLAREAG